MQTVTVGLTQMITPESATKCGRITATSRVGTNYALDNFGGAVPLPDSLLFPPGIRPPMAFSHFISRVPGNTVRASTATDEQRQINLVDNLSVTKGGHQLKFGVDYRWLSPFSSPFYYRQFAQFSGMSSESRRSSFGNGRGRRGSTPCKANALLSQNFSLLCPGHLESHAPIHLDLWLAVGRQPAAEGQEPGERSIHRDGPEQSGDDGPGASRHSALPNHLWKRGAAGGTGLSTRRDKQNWGAVSSRGASGCFTISGPVRSAEYPATFHTATSSFISWRAVSLKRSERGSSALTVSPPVPHLLVAEPNLKLPRTYEWNIALEQSLGRARVYPSRTSARLGATCFV